MESACQCPECGSDQTERVGLPQFKTKTEKDPDNDSFHIDLLGTSYDRSCRMCGCRFTEFVLEHS
jgi:hypothetical protein